jgi:hypothetical protein
MKHLTFTIRLLVITIAIIFCNLNHVFSQGFGKTFNLGIGLGYYNYVGHSVPVLHADYEFSVSENFTLAPFISIYSYRTGYKYNNDRYYYHETAIPIGLKGSFYLDELLQAGSPWDFYIGGSLGLRIIHTYWDNNYQGDQDIFEHGSSLYLNAHFGTEYHFNSKIGAFLDLSSGMSTIGLSFH